MRWIRQVDPLLWFYFVRPVERLAENWPVKAVAVVVATTFWGVVETAIGAYTNLLSMPIYLLALASLAFFGDFASAVLAAIRDDGVEGIELIKFRQLLIKAAYWVIIIFAFSSLATGAEQANIPLLDKVDVASVFWLSLQDLWSMVQNWKGDGAVTWWRGMMELSKGDLSIDSLEKLNENQSES